MKKVLLVDGMMCAHCQAHVQKALAGVSGVTEAVVDLDSKGHGDAGGRCGGPGADGCCDGSRLHAGQLRNGCVIRENKS